VVNLVQSQFKVPYRKNFLFWHCCLFCFCRSRKNNDNEFFPRDGNRKFSYHLIFGSIFVQRKFLNEHLPFLTMFLILVCSVPLDPKIVLSHISKTDILGHIRFDFSLVFQVLCTLWTPYSDTPNPCSWHCCFCHGRVESGFTDLLFLSRSGRVGFHGSDNPLVESLSHIPSVTTRETWLWRVCVCSHKFSRTGVVQYCVYYKRWCGFVWYVTIKRELNKRLIYECRCYERLKKLRDLHASHYTVLYTVLRGSLR
jgi:hypothetical protein